jgi:hypothetical protein
MTLPVQEMGEGKGEGGGGGGGRRGGKGKGEGEWGDYAQTLMDKLISPIYCKTYSLTFSMQDTVNVMVHVVKGQ